MDGQSGGRKMPSASGDEARVALVRAAGVQVSEADAKRVAESVGGSLKALDKAVTGSLFDTEPQTFDDTLRKLAKGGGRE
jgi:hypothetical protein